MTNHARVVVFGASGFVGGAVALAVEDSGATVVRLPAPRLARLTESEARDAALRFAEMVREVAASIPPGCSVVNAAGLSESTQGDEGELMAANCGVAAVLATAARARGVRFVHVSSASVQGRRVLDATSNYAPFSPYSRSKVAGEQAVREAHPDAVVYRPPGVHGTNRDVTRSIARLARSRLSSVAAPGTDNSAQALLQNVADACAFLALSPTPPPACVSHPSEGITTAGLLNALGGKAPRTVPRYLARLCVITARQLGRLSAAMAANARRLEILWFGQEQQASWLASAGWRPLVGISGWHDLGQELHHEQDEL